MLNREIKVTMPAIYAKRLPPTNQKVNLLISSRQTANFAPIFYHFRTFVTNIIPQYLVVATFKLLYRSDCNWAINFMQFQLTFLSKAVMLHASSRPVKYG